MKFQETLTVCVGTALCLWGAANAIADPLPAETIRRLADENKRPAIELYREFLSLPNDANYPDDILNMVVWMEDAFGARGFSTQRISTEGSPLLLAERHVSDAAKTVLVYLQSDGQPVDPAAWFQEDPYTPVLKERTSDGQFERIPWDLLTNSFDPEWRVFARSSYWMTPDSRPTTT
jgi:hypothetical protein